MDILKDFLPDSFLFSNTFFAINRLDLVRFIATAFIICCLGTIASKSLKRANEGVYVPTKPQSLVEIGLQFVKEFIFEAMGEKKGKRWIPMITTIFFTVLFFNFTGIIPGLNIGATASFAVPVLLAIWVFTAYWREGIKSHGGAIKGLLSFVKTELFPPGLPIFVYPLYALLEFLQLVIIRPASLAIRLFANMISGHILLSLCFTGTQFLLFVAMGPLKAVGFVTFFGGMFCYCFEILVACLQAYVFALLTCVYISLTEPHH